MPSDGARDVTPAGEAGTEARSSPEPLFGWTSIAVLAVAVSALGALSVTLGQDANWDLRNYHVYNAYAFLRGRFDWDIGAAQQQTYHNPLIDAATYMFIEHAPPRFVGFVLGALQGVNFWLVYSISRTVLAGFTGRQEIVLALACAALGAFGAIGLAELGTTLHDLTTAMFVLAGTLMLLRATVHASPRATLLACSGFLFGLGTGFKYTLAIYSLAALVATIAAVSTRRQRFVSCFVLGAAMGTGVLASGGYWMLRLWSRFGNPLFPYYNDVFLSDYTVPFNHVDAVAVPPTLVDAIAFPFHLEQFGFRDFRLASVFVLLVVVAGLSPLAHLFPFFRRYLQAPAARPRTARWLLVFLAVAYVAWLRQWAIYRYIVPVEQLAPLALLLLASLMIRDRRHLAIAACVSFLVLGLTTKPFDFGRVAWSDDFLGVTVPPIGDPKNATVVMSSFEPTSFVIPAFPAEVRFVRILSNFFTPEMRTRLADEIVEALRPEGRDYYLLTVYDAIEWSRPDLAVYALGIVGRSCAPLVNKLDERIVFCRLTKIAPDGSAPAGDAAGADEPAIDFGSLAAAAGATGTLTAAANPAPACATTGAAATTIAWTATGTDRIEIHVGAPNGPLFVQGGAAGTVKTDYWVVRGTTFYLQNTANGAPLVPGHTLARLVMQTVPGGPCP